ncbi:MAG: GLPGLI family protein [Promethearchaeota archaeon]
MKEIIISICLTVFLFTTSLIAQNFQGRAIYESKTNLDIDFSKSGIPADRIKIFQERMKSNLEKTYELTFNKTASIYKEEEKLDQTSSRGGMRFLMMTGGVSGKHYKNVQTKKSTKENEFSGKNFLIKDELVTYKWKMEKETKMIGDQMGFKATTVVNMPVRREMRFGRRNNNEEDKREEEAIKQPTSEPVIVTAWYTLDIPISQGPGDYWGLPGLILEVSVRDTKIMCTKIVLNPKEKTELKEPKKGKIVTQEEYDEIVAKKTEEMRERFRNERQKSGSERGMMRHGN